MVFVKFNNESLNTFTTEKFCALKAIVCAYKTKTKAEKKPEGITKGTLGKIVFDKFFDCVFN